MVLYRWATREASTVSFRPSSWRNLVLDLFCECTWFSYFGKFLMFGPKTATLCIWWLSCPNIWDPMDCSALRLPFPSPFSGACSKFCPLISVISFNSLVLCHPFCLSVFPKIRDFFSESADQHQVWVLELPLIVLSNEYSVLISLRIDWFESCNQGLSKSASTPQLKSIYLSKTKPRIIMLRVSDAIWRPSRRPCPFSFCI